MTTYRAVPATQSYAPARAFSNALEALRYARQAAQGFRVAYSVWACQGPRLKLLGQFPAGRRD